MIKLHDSFTFLKTLPAFFILKNIFLNDINYFLIIFLTYFFFTNTQKEFQSLENFTEIHFILQNKLN